LIVAETDSNGEVFYQDLKPGRYFIAYLGDKLPTSKLAFEVFLSSEQELKDFIGLAEE
jgi:hypothetical protein